MPLPFNNEKGIKKFTKTKKIHNLHLTDTKNSTKFFTF